MAFNSLDNYRSCGVQKPPETIEECFHVLEIGMDMVYCILNHARGMEAAKVDPPGKADHETMRPLFETVLSKFNRWSQTVARLVADEQSADRPDDRHKPGLLILQMYAAVMRAMLSNLPNLDCPDEAGVVRAVDIAEEFLQGYNGAGDNRSFSLSTGVIRTLFQIAWRTRDAAIREKSLRLLRTARRREGV